MKFGHGEVLNEATRANHGDLPCGTCRHFQSDHGKEERRCLQWNCPCTNFIDPRSVAGWDLADATPRPPEGEK